MDRTQLLILLSTLNTAIIKALQDTNRALPWVLSKPLRALVAIVLGAVEAGIEAVALGSGAFLPMVVTTLTASAPSLILLVVEMANTKPGEPLKSMKPPPPAVLGVMGLCLVLGMGAGCKGGLPPAQTVVDEIVSVGQATQGWLVAAKSIADGVFLVAPNAAAQTKVTDAFSEAALAVSTLTSAGQAEQSIAAGNIPLAIANAQTSITNFIAALKEAGIAAPAPADGSHRLLAVGKSHARTIPEPAILSYHPRQS